MLVLIGKTCSGKDSVVRKLVKEHGFKKIVTYTTRPKRKNERDGVTYNFVSDEEFKEKIDSGFFAEWKKYNSTERIWYYGTALDDIRNADDKTVIILTPDGYRDLAKELKDSLSIYLYSNNNTIKNRLLKRGDSKEEANRRLENDNKDFKGVENIVTKIVYNNEGNDIQSVAQTILDIIAKK